jgi:hypothetical protein
MIYIKKFGKILLWFGLAFILQLPACADNVPPAGATQAMPQAPPRKIIFLQLPLTLKGDFFPIFQAEMLKSLEADVEKIAPLVDLVPLSPDDPNLKDMDLNLSVENAAKLAQAFKADFVSWGGIQFSFSKIVTQAAASSPVYQYILTVQALANIQIFDAAANKIVVDQVMSQSNNATTRAFEDSEPYKALQKDLAQQCVKDLAFNLVKSLKDRLQMLYK